jgi:hypothetical protein
MVLRRASVRGNSDAWRFCKGQLSRTDICKGQVRLPLLGINTHLLAVQALKTVKG